MAATSLSRGALFQRDDVAPTLLKEVLDERYGSKWVSGWEEPETIWQTIELDHGLGKGSIAPACRDKISVMRVLANQDAIWELMVVFAPAVTAFNGMVPNWSVLEGARPEELSYFMSQTQRLGWQDEPSEEVSRYAAGLLGMDGWVAVPPHCEAFQGRLDEYNLRTSTQARLDEIKSRVAARLGVVVRDDDENAIDVAVARHQAVRLYLKKQDERERRMRDRLQEAA